ncbi:JAB domain-containing protein [Ohtaekwangia koreensis]|uniref:DNA repair protein RadC n=1 Tax=Ohtaekwangia koreensis TaxID=688867 RepID=A0A1T5MKW9_9BACT|nr:JAB domain-containing protein [Ohtaekwangia koreensis]SKC88867.1 DNA repair protein RadC [Ohtaekwangia koreensis]
MNVRLSSSQKIAVLNSTDIFTIMQAILLRENKIRRNQEHFWVIGLNRANKILFIELVSLGATNRVEVKPAEVFRIAIYKSAVKMILVHNHPSGSIKVSEADRDFTDRMIKSGDMLAIEVLDHLVITEETYISFADKGILDELKQSGRYELIDKEKGWLQEMKLEAEIDKRNKEIATNLKKAGVDIDTIKQATGLTKTEIKSLKID